MKPMATWVVPPRREAISIINAGLEAFFRTNGFTNLDSQRLQVCVEGVFIYCANNIRAFDSSKNIHVNLLWEEHDVKIIIQHAGPKGEWDDSLKNSSFPIRRTSFEAMGLFIAKEILNNLSYESLLDVVTGQVSNNYELVYRMEWPDGQSENDAGDTKDPNSKELLAYLNSTV